MGYLIKYYFNHNDKIDLKDGFIRRESTFHQKFDHPMDLLVAKKNLLDLNRVFKNNQISFWLMFGTLLGAIREKNFILHDQDIDLGLFKKDLLSTIKGVDILIKEYDFQVIKVSEKDDLITLYREGVIIELSFFDVTKNKDYYEFLTFKFPTKYFKKFEEILFLEDTFNVPINPIEILEYHYGAQWNITIHNFYSRKRKYFITPMIFLVNIIIQDLEKSTKLVHKLLRIE